MNGLGSFHRIGTVAVPRAPGQGGDRAGDAATAKTKKPHVLGNGKRAPGHLPHPSEANMHVPAYRTRVRGYMGVAIHTSTPTDDRRREQQCTRVPVPATMPLRPAGNVHFVRPIQVL